ncbi:ComEA family DNA-binding protein [Xenorhabdus szentirmaii]|uniref:Helix-hairpin-helix DNA-binding motif class 1 domain-containing protein n=3 Tax=Xenorhabdus szentirmaii TaxID=290112 RepID=W1IZJ4_9GAMM|nr:MULTISPECIES: ComEA family DNA-binding protein [Xenorhabdus]MBD2779495.1 ComEA family DNA-binding protein [Xenorhabdus sp. 38]MBD2790979.1 ComEA family DNA-binding protein [Xenorhabdus sp. CUL]MBD2799150.1 ComEA family DNA-binding protein [Xenorhabdus sp. M]MBD2804015.1 ComEA family DNA-binding protein [Xenorhabdus sp. ZM]MBD2820197.1 ComEA family DNA-binding protein [Xenorhabdus sp. 42]
MKYLRILFNSLIMVLCINMSLSYANTANELADKTVKQPVTQQKSSTESNAVKEGKGIININTASTEELVKELNGVGIKKAQAIVEYREKYGPFTAVEQLQEVQGIGPIFIEKNRDKLTH